jgi:glutamyl-tRNA reductase
MSVLAVGLSHRSAPVATLERAVLTGDPLGKLLQDLYHTPDVAGTFVVSTCNRAEVYGDVERFHSGVSAISDLLARHSGVALAELTPHLYVHYEDRAAQHLMSVACGLDSMVIGESQILGQVRQALRLAREKGTLNGALSELGSLALRAGKRAHAETGIDRVGANLVGVGLAAAAARLRLLAPARPREEAASGTLAGLSVLVVGAGSMSSLAVATAARMDAASVVVANRTRTHAERLAHTVSGGSADLSRLPAEIAAADLVVSCTGAPGHVISADAVAEALKLRNLTGGPLVLLDLAVPRDVDPAAAALRGVSVIGIEELRTASTPGSVAPEEDVAAVRHIVAEELAAHLAASQAARVAPTVVALRAKAAEVVATELARLDSRVEALDPKARSEIGKSMRRVADKLLHTPTVRVKELAGLPAAETYEAALRVLFDLDPDAVQAVAMPEVGPAGARGAPAVPGPRQAGAGGPAVAQ